MAALKRKIVLKSLEEFEGDVRAYFGPEVNTSGGIRSECGLMWSLVGYLRSQDPEYLEREAARRKKAEK